MAPFLRFETYKLALGRHLVGTNMFYGGIYNLASPDYILSYYAEAELLNDVAEHKMRIDVCQRAAAQLAYLAYEEVAA